MGAEVYVQGFGKGNIPVFILSMVLFLMDSRILLLIIYSVFYFFSYFYFHST